jgi:hypothetical protein
MKHRFVTTLIGATAAVWIAAVQAATPAPEWLGTWELDATRSQRPPNADAGQPAPKSVTITFKDAGGGKVAFQQVAVGADGKKMETSGGFSTDGSPALIVGSPAFDRITVSYSDAHTESASFFKGGKLVQKFTTVLSADGRHRTQTVETTDKEGKSIKSTVYWDKK